MSETSPPDDLAVLDVSMVVNIHAGAPYLARTMRSLEASAILARQGGQRVELLLALDNSPPDTAAWIEGYSSSAFERIRIVHFSHGSLAHSRQAGLEVARAEYVQFCDEDDLVSANTTYVSYRTARKLGPRTIVVPEYSLGFGTQRFLAVYEGSGSATPLQLFSAHPFVSRVFVHRSIIGDVRYGDIKLGTGYAYEDWHFNAEALAAGYQFAVAPQTILFYRHRTRSLLTNMDRHSARLIPPNALFVPKRFLNIARRGARGFARTGQRYDRPVNESERFSLHPANARAVAEASAIEPAIDAASISNLPIIAMRDIDQRPGVAYFQACRRVGVERFTDVALADNGEDGGGIANVLGALANADPSRRSLLLIDDVASPRIGVPPNTVLIDMRSLGAGDDIGATDTIALRLIESAPNARLHIAAGVFGGRVLGRFGTLLKDREIVAYRNPAPVTSAYGRRVRVDRGFDMISENLEKFARVVAPSESDRAFDVARLDRRIDIWTTLYQKRVVARARARGATVTKRVLALASASAPFEVARVERAAGLQIDPVAILRDTNWADYDALLLLDPDAVTFNELAAALCAGVPVVGEKRGALGEVLEDRVTGLVVPEISWETPIREAAYASILKTLHEEPDLQAQLAERTLACAARRHGDQAHLTAVLALFGLSHIENKGGAA